MSIMKRTIPAEITAFKEKMFFGMTVRQLACAAGILATAIPTGIFGSKVLPQDVVGYLIMIEVIPLAAIGWLQYNDMPIEIIGKKAISYYINPQKRKFKYLMADIIKIHNFEVDEAYKEELALRKEEVKRNKEQLKKDKKRATSTHKKELKDNAGK